MSRRDLDRLEDIREAVAAINSHLARGGLDDGLVFDAVRIRLLEIGEAVKALPASLLASEPGVDWPAVSRFRDQLADHYWDTAHAILQYVVDVDLPQLAAATTRLASGARSDDGAGQS